jgi:hypothetical protein
MVAAGTGENCTRIRWIFANAVANGCKIIPPLEWQNVSKVKTSKVVATFLSVSPRTQSLLGLMNDFCTVRQEKMVAWFSYPTIHSIVKEILMFFKYRLHSITAETSITERDKIRGYCTDRKTRFDLVMAQIRIGGTGWNIQEDMRVAVIFDMVESYDELMQVTGRLWRTGQVSEVLMYILHQGNTQDAARRQYVLLRRGKLCQNPAPLSFASADHP